MSSIARRALLAAGVLLAALGLTATAAAADDWGQPVAGRHVYDTTSALTAQQVADLEQAAAAVDRAGAPTVVYLRAKDAGDDATRQDARNLMDAWSVESAPGAKDGFVLLLNLEPGDSRHGSAALVAGTEHADRLDDARLQGIYDGTMKPYLARADLAGALTAALGTVVEDLTGTAPSPAAPAAGGIPVAAVFAAILLGMGGLFAAVIAVLVLLVRVGLRGGGGSDDDSDRLSWSGPGPDTTGSSFTGDGGASSGSSSGGGSF